MCGVVSYFETVLYGITSSLEAIKQKNRTLRQRKFKVVNLSIAYSVSIVK